MKTISKKKFRELILENYALDIELSKAEGVYYYVSDSKAESAMLSEFEESCSHCCVLDSAELLRHFNWLYQDWLEKQDRLYPSTTFKDIITRILRNN